MKDYNTILSRVEHSLKFYSKDYVKGYIYGLLDWYVITIETYERLRNLVDNYIRKNKSKKV